MLHLQCWSRGFSSLVNENLRSSFFPSPIPPKPEFCLARVCSALALLETKAVLCLEVWHVLYASSLEASYITGCFGFSKILLLILKVPLKMHSLCFAGTVKTL